MDGGHEGEGKHYKPAAGRDRRWRMQLGTLAGRVRGWPAQPAALVVGVIAAVALIGGVALAARDGDARPSPEAARSASSTSPSPGPGDSAGTTTPAGPAETAAPATDPGSPPSSPPPRAGGSATPDGGPATCADPWPPAAAPQPTVPAPPGQSVAFGPPAPSCVDVDGGCLVSVVLRWSDGYAEVGSLLLAAPGSYTVNGDRGTTWTFAVGDDQVCTTTGGTYADVWPPGT